jgi:hypothetical protein
MKITKDLFVWKIITHKQASDIFHLGIFDVFRLNENGSESMIESEEDLLEAYYEKAVMGVEVGKIDLHGVLTNSGRVGITWSESDIIDVADISLKEILTEKEINTVMHRLESFHDANIGINWDVIKCQIQMVIDERNKG